MADGHLHDASLRLANSLAEVGFEADGATRMVDAFTVAQDGTVKANGKLETQIGKSLAALNEEIKAAGKAGESQSQLKERYDDATEALVEQLVQMGLTQAQAQSLIDTILKTPSEADTTFTSNAPEAAAQVEELNNSVITLSDGSVTIIADTSPAETSIATFMAKNRRITVHVDATGGQKYSIGGTDLTYQARGSVLEFMAGGGMRGLSPMQNIAQMVSPNTYRVVGDRGDVPEAFVPLDGSARSWGGGGR